MEVDQISRVPPELDQVSRSLQTARPLTVPPSADWMLPLSFLLSLEMPEAAHLPPATAMGLVAHRAVDLFPDYTAHTSQCPSCH